MRKRSLKLLIVGYFAFLVFLGILFFVGFYIGVPNIHSGEEFHQWVASLTWWQRMYFDIFDPEAVHCTLGWGLFPYGFPYGVLVDVILILVGAVLVVQYWLVDE